MKGRCVTLPTKVKIQQGDEVEWTSEDKSTLVTGMNGDDSKTSYTDDERFKDRLKMNPKTGNLTITDIRQTDEGVYTLKLTKADGEITYRIFNVDVNAKVYGNFLKQQNSARVRTGKVGEFVTLDTGVTRIQRDDEIMWTFEDMRIARYIGGTNESTLYDYIDERFKDRLEVKHQTGDLTIRNIRTEHTGEYKVQIKNSNGNKERKFNLAFYVRAMKGRSVTLLTKVKIQQGDEVTWTSKDKTSLVTGMNRDDSETSYTDDERFRDRLEMNPETGELTITDIRQTDEGVYTLQLTKADGKITYRIFNVDVIAKAQGNNKIQPISVEAMQGTCVTLYTKVKIQERDKMKWTSEDKSTLVAGMNGDDSKTLYTEDERFRDRLKMNAQTGDLIIRDIRERDKGVYTLQLINTDGKIKYILFKVDVFVPAKVHGNIQNRQNSVQAKKGGSVTILTEVKIQQGDEVEWTSEDKTILVTGMNGDRNKTSYTDDERFRRRLDMNPETGDLTILDISQTDKGDYTLQLTKADGKIAYIVFNVDVNADAQGNFQIQLKSGLGNIQIRPNSDSAGVSDESVAVTMPLLKQEAGRSSSSAM
ncbi:cell adhesion molecule CEACAM3-like [Paramisgurnus dabryanus]|uniref:cell adhesion molecule CEACAM3-like n=1 Tax=Paramisgurnus dabryanus TaxID=90735 RepID=UPI003CCF28F7